MTRSYWTSSTAKAVSVLRAWVSCDPQRIRAELERSIRTSEESEDGIDGEHNALLLTVAQRLQQCPDLFAVPAEDPALDLCFDLLIHIIRRDASVKDQDLIQSLPFVRKSKDRHAHEIQLVLQ